MVLCAQFLLKASLWSTTTPSKTKGQTEKKESRFFINSLNFEASFLKMAKPFSFLPISYERKTMFVESQYLNLIWSKYFETLSLFAPL